MDLLKPFLVISDLQIPYEAKRALEFCVHIKKHYGIPDENVINIGDEFDCLHGGNWPKDPDTALSATGELGQAREKIKRWISYFPKAMVCMSNHGMRWVKKATMAEIPSQLMRSYKDVYGMPDSWVYQMTWTIKTKHPFLAKHGMDCSGKTPYRGSAESSTISTVFGHLHSSPGVCYVKTPEKYVWSMNSGCLIDVEADAFRYERVNRFKPVLGCSVICNQGSLPIFLPYE